MKKGATIFKRGDKFIIVPVNHTTVGIGISGTPVYTLDERSTTPTNLAEAVKNALQDSKDGVPHPTHFDGLKGPVLEAAQVKSWNTFVKGSKCVEVRLQDGVLTLMPTTNSGKKEGFVFNKDLNISLQASSTEIESALVKSLELSK